MKLITLKAKDIKEIIAFRFGEKLAKDKFVYKKNHNQFVCTKDDFEFIFNILLTAWSDHFSITVRLFISQKKIEEVFEKVVGKSHKLTIGNTIQRISKSPDGKQIVNGDMAILLIQNEDVEAAVETLERYFRDIAISYFDKYKSIEAIDEIMNNPPFDHCPAHVGGNFDERCMKGLIVARIVNNPRYEQLLAIYDDSIKETMNNLSIENYYKVREYLMYNRVS